MKDYDARLVDLYDLDNPDGPDHDFYRVLADENGALSILDLGCGTGILTVTLASAGRTVVGVDPSRTMLAYARERPGAAGVRWILGDSRAVPPDSFDCVVMTGNVAQHIVDPDWARTLRDLRARMRTGGVLAFESRNPAARAWERWAEQGRTRRGTAHGLLEEWMEVTKVRAPNVTVAFHNDFVDTGETVTETAQLAFRDRRTIENQLRAAGFAVEAVYGTWERDPITEQASLMLFTARAQ